MPLTPQDVRDKQFTPTRFKTGYDEDEVDSFLDVVEAELTRLLDENSSLRRQVESMQAAAPAAVPVVAPAPAPDPAPAPARADIDAPVVMSPGATEMEEMLRRTLLLAQRTADEAVAEARTEAERLLREARAEADSTTAAARVQAQQTEADAAERQAASLAQYDAQRRQLEGRVQQLRAFEQEYRTRLRAYLELQLRELEGVAAEVPPAAGGSSAGGGPATAPGVNLATPPPPDAAGTEDRVAGDGERPDAPPAAMRLPDPPVT